MKNPLPEKLELKLLSVFGYAAVVLSGYLSFRFLLDFFSGCGQGDGGLVPASLLFGIANAGIGISLFFAVWGLRHRPHLKHAFLTFGLIVAVAIIQLYVATYVSLGNGMACAV